MSRGENPAFRERVGVLSERLRRLNVERMIEARYSEDLDVLRDRVDIDAFITREETPAEIFESLKPYLDMAVEKSFEDLSESELENELEKYRALAERTEGVIFDE